MKALHEALKAESSSGELNVLEIPGLWYALLSMAAERICRHRVKPAPVINT